MYPVILEIGPIIVYSLWLFAGIALLASVFMFEYLARLKRLHMNFIYHHSLAIFIWGLVGSRLLYVLINFQVYFPDFTLSSFLRILYIWNDKGLSLIGALLGIGISLLYFSIKEKEQTKRWLDIFSISVITGLGIGHLGTFLDGSAYGRETSLPWGMVFDSPSIKYAVPIHPVQLYAALYSIIIVVVLYLLYRKSKFKAGVIAAAGIISYMSMTFLSGFLRGDDVFVFLGLRDEQIFALATLILTGTYLFLRYNKKRKKKSPHQPA
ncbi:prolipoprotein diacylglyceryl transferase [Patescibacteria group bacterium]